MDAVEQHTTPTVSFTYSVEGEATDPSPDSATVDISRADGTVLHTGAATTNQANGVFTYALSAGDTAQLGRLAFDWHVGSQTFHTVVDVVGGFYFTISEFLERYPAVDASPAAIANARATAEEIIEGLDTKDGCHQAFVPRAETFELSGPMGTIEIPRYHLREVMAITFDGVDQDLDGLLLSDRSIEGGSWGRGNLFVEVVHGLDAPPRRIKEAAMILAYNRLVNGPIDDRAIGRMTPEGSVISLATPGLRGAVTGLPEVDAAIAQYSKRRIRPTSVYISDRGSPATSRLDFFI